MASNFFTNLLSQQKALPVDKDAGCFVHKSIARGSKQYFSSCPLSDIPICESEARSGGIDSFVIKEERISRYGWLNSSAEDNVNTVGSHFLLKFPN